MFFCQQEAMRIARRLMLDINGATIDSGVMRMAGSSASRSAA
jgi:hypothetical protein